MNEKKVLIIAGIITLIGFGVWFFWETKPKPGTLMPDLGRGHIPVGTEQKYNSNPPTSGPHYEEWTKPGIYNSPRDDRNLVHSLEHGYIIISYNCAFKQSFLKITQTFAQEPPASMQPGLTGVMKEASDSATPSASLSPDFQSPDCQSLVKQLTDVYNEKGPHKLILIPRPNLDAKIAVTAWRYLDKFNTFDKGRITKFIDALRDQGPEKTFEP